jgi:cell division protein FtsB
MRGWVGKSILLLIMALLFASGVMTAYGRHRTRMEELEAIRSEKEMEISRIEDRIQVREDLLASSNDPDFVERMARFYGMVRDNELIYKDQDRTETEDPMADLFKN